MVGFPHAPLRLVLVLAGVGLATLWTVLLAMGAPRAPSTGTPGTDLATRGRGYDLAGPRTLEGADHLHDECGSPNPFLGASRFIYDVHASNRAGRTVVFAFRDTADDLPERQVALATYGQVGTVYGLAFDASRNQLYAAAYLKRGSAFPAGGPGVISRIDLAT
jgi:hypothetical protein